MNGRWRGRGWPARKRQKQKGDPPGGFSVPRFGAAGVRAPHGVLPHAHAAGLVHRPSIASFRINPDDLVRDTIACEAVINGRKLVHIPDRILELYPDDPDLRDVGAVSYLGVR